MNSNYTEKGIKNMDGNKAIFHLHPCYSEFCGASASKTDIHCTNSKDVSCPTCRNNLDNATLQAGDNFTFNFDRTKFVGLNAIINQIAHISTEVDESVEASMTADNLHLAEELMDVLHSTESALRIMKEFHGINLNEVRSAVKSKNRERGYYVAD